MNTCLPVRDLKPVAHMGCSNSEKWALFYRPFFPHEDLARDFVSSVETLCSGDGRHQAKIMMHQTHRLVSLADDLPSIRRNNETLQLLFLLICAENIAKLADNFDEDGKSRAYVQNFFTWFLTPEEQQQICTGITGHGYQPFTLREAVNALNDVRCDIVHEGKYWGFHFRGTQGPILNTEPDVIVSLTLSEFRRIVVKGCIAAIQTYPRSQGNVRGAG